MNNHNNSVPWTTNPNNAQQFVPQQSTQFVAQPSTSFTVQPTSSTTMFPHSQVPIHYVPQQQFPQYFSTPDNRYDMPYKKTRRGGRGARTQFNSSKKKGNITPKFVVLSYMNLFVAQNVNAETDSAVITELKVLQNKGKLIVNF